MQTDILFYLCWPFYIDTHLLPEYMSVRYGMLLSHSAVRVAKDHDEEWKPTISNQGYQTNAYSTKNPDRGIGR